MHWTYEPTYSSLGAPVPLHFHPRLDHLLSFCHLRNIDFITLLPEILDTVGPTLFLEISLTHSSNVLVYLASEPLWTLVFGPFSQRKKAPPALGCKIPPRSCLQFIGLESFIALIHPDSRVERPWHKSARPPRAKSASILFKAIYARPPVEGGFELDNSLHWSTLLYAVRVAVPWRENFADSGSLSDSISLSTTLRPATIQISPPCLQTRRTLQAPAFKYPPDRQPIVTSIRTQSTSREEAGFFPTKSGLLIQHQGHEPQTSRGQLLKPLNQKTLAILCIDVT